MHYAITSTIVVIEWNNVESRITYSTSTQSISSEKNQRMFSFRSIGQYIMIWEIIHLLGSFFISSFSIIYHLWKKSWVCFPESFHNRGKCKEHIIQKQQQCRKISLILWFIFFFTKRCHRMLQFYWYVIFHDIKILRYWKYYYSILKNVVAMIFSIRLKTINLDISITIILTDKKRVLHVEWTLRELG